MSDDGEHMTPAETPAKDFTRRAFLRRTAGGIGAAALASLVDPAIVHGFTENAVMTLPAAVRKTEFAPKAKRVIYLCQSGGPSQLELFDPKPNLDKLRGTTLPASVRGRDLGGISSEPASFSIANSRFKFAPHGECGTMISELLPHTASIVDELCIIRTMHTDSMHHEPAMALLHTGSLQSRRPSLGAWACCGLGSENQDMPAYVVMISGGTGRALDQPLYDRLWGAGFLPDKYEGVRLCGEGGPAEYEHAYRVHAASPELTDLACEPASIVDMYGPDAHKRGSYAANCLMARRLCERGVRFVQLFHTGWDLHYDLPDGLHVQCRDTDQPSAALIKDLKQRGMLDETLVIWAGEFGRSVCGTREFTADNYGRDHHPHCFSIWMAGGGIKGGIIHGRTDDFGYSIVEGGVHVHDLNATILACLGIDHLKLTFPLRGPQYRLTKMAGNIVKQIMA